MTKDELSKLIKDRFTPIGFNCEEPDCDCRKTLGAAEYAQKDTAERIARFISTLNEEVTL